METPLAFKYAPWTGFPRQSYSILVDNYAHEKPLNVRFIHKSPRLNILSKNQIRQHKSEFFLANSLEMIFKVNTEKYLFFKSNEKQVNLMYDHGKVSVRNFWINLYGGLESKLANQHRGPHIHNKKTQNNYKIGAIWKNSLGEIDHQFILQTSKNDQMSYLTANKLNFHYNKWSVWAYKITRLGLSPTIVKNAIKVGYRINEDTEIFLRGVNLKERPFSKFAWMKYDSYYQDVAFNLYRRINDKLEFAGEIYFEGISLKQSSAAIVKKFDKWDLQLKLRAIVEQTSKFFAMSIQKPLSSYGKCIAGISCEKFKEKYYFSSGIRFDINL